MIVEKYTLIIENVNNQLQMIIEKCILIVGNVNNRLQMIIDSEFDCKMITFDYKEQLLIAENDY